ncbi:MAG: chromosome segregation protein SMC [Bacillota bacterium]
MQIKRLDLQGFKSFADHLHLDFGPGITTIVGPNGSGKSNIAEAIKWVLGEQSMKSLRGTKLEDVIFGGSSTRRQLGMAEVSITMDNSKGILPLEFQEVSIARRVFRSGESEYLVNKAGTRLKDVQDLLLDTGVGKESFSFIGQGKVEEILNLKPEDRRGLLEEAAGVVRYRNRKREAARKLEDTQTNLVRLDDIIGELGNQVEPLAREAEKAKIFLTLQEELETLEITLSADSLEKLYQDRDRLEGESEEARLRLVEQQTGKAKADAAFEENRLRLKYCEEKLTAKQQELMEITVRIQKMEGQIGVDRERMRLLEGQVHALAGEIEQASEKHSFTGEEMTEAESKQLSIQEKLSGQQKALYSAERNLVEVRTRRENGEKELEDLKSRLIDLLNARARVQNRLAQAEQRSSSLRSQAERLIKEINTLEQELSQEQVKEKDLVAEKDRLALQMVNIKKRREHLLREKEAKEDLLADFRCKLDALQEEAQIRNSRLRALKEMQRDFEGFYGGVKAVLKGLERGETLCQGVYGVVAELLATDAKYETALEVALGGALQYLVTDNEKGARQAIQYLKDSKAGRATFLPLNTILPRKIPERLDPVLQLPGVIGAASDLVSVEPRYQRVVEHLLGNIIIAHNMPAAEKAARAAGFAYRVVTLEGEVIHPGGAFTGGSIRRQQSSLLGRTREIARLEEQVKEFEEHLSRSRESLNVGTAELNAITETISDLEIKTQEIQISITTREQEILALINGMGRLASRVEVLQLEMERFAGEETEIAREKENHVDDDAKFREEEELINGTIIITREENSRLGGMQQQLAEEITLLKVNVATLAQEEKGCRENLGRIRRMQNEQQQLAENKQAQLASLKGEIARTEDHLNGCQELVTKLTLGKVAEEGQWQCLREEREGLRQQFEALENEGRERLKSLEQAQKNTHNMELQKTRLFMEIEAREAMLMEKFNLNYDEAQQRKVIPVQPRIIQKRIDYLQEESQKLGPVNVPAIDEHQRLTHRHRFLTGQRADLEEARDSLLEVVREMDGIMVKKFRSTFQSVSDAFSKVFQILFGGGQARLELTDPDNLLETGIDIIAQPPGKKLQYLSLLSGGERALTVIALLFALFQVRPAPFCILDEIEASLDEANVERFAQFLQELAGHTQFLIVTHRQRTMEIADVLYGVTMEESGVSKVVSVKLAEAAARVS